MFCDCNLNRIMHNCFVGISVKKSHVDFSWLTGIRSNNWWREFNEELNVSISYRCWWQVLLRKAITKCTIRYGRDHNDKKQKCTKCECKMYLQVSDPL